MSEHTADGSSLHGQLLSLAGWTLPPFLELIVRYVKHLLCLGIYPETHPFFRGFAVSAQQLQVEVNLNCHF